MDRASYHGEQVSQTIRVARVLCIYFMMLVHVPPGFDSYAPTAKHEAGAFFYLQTFLTGVLGRSSVPLLSIISGYLAVASLARHGFAKYATGRFYTLYVPIVFWNALLLLFGLAAFSLLGVKTSAYESVADFGPFQMIYGALLTLDYSGITVALKFLRDLFVCGLLLPLLIWPARKAPLSSLILVVVVSSTGWLEPVIYRPAILQFFYLGVILHFNRHLVSAVPRYAGFVAAGLVGVCVVYFLLFFGHMDPDTFKLGPADVFSSIRQLVVATAVWCFCFWLAGISASRWLVRFEPVMFLTYLSHVFIFGLGWFAWQRIEGGSPSSAAYPIFFLGAPLALLFAASAVDPWLSRLPRPLQIMIKGKAARRRQEAPARGQTASAPAPFTEPEPEPEPEPELPRSER